MTRGNPDYLLPNYDIAIPTTDFGEMIPFMFGISRVDALGRAVFVDNFAGGLNRWNVGAGGSGVNAICYWGNNSALSNGLSVQLDPVALNGSSSISTYITYPGIKKIGLEFAVNLPQNFADFTFGLGATSASGTLKLCAIKVNEPNGDFTLTHNAGSTVIFTPSSVNNLTTKWIVAKLVIDGSTGKLDALRLPGSFIDLSAYDLYSGGGGLYNMVYVQINSVCRNSNYAEPSSLGYVILTTDEL